MLVQNKIGLSVRNLLDAFGGGVMFNIDKKRCGKLKLSKANVGKDRARFIAYDSSNEEKLGFIDFEIMWLDSGQHRFQVSIVNSNIPQRVKENLIKEWLTRAEFRMPSGARLAIDLDAFVPDWRSELEVKRPLINAAPHIRTISDILRQRWLYNIDVQNIQQNGSAVIRVVGTVDKDKLKKEAPAGIVVQTSGTKKDLIQKGGIDLSPAKINLKTQDNGYGVTFNLDPAMLAQLQNARGFVPVIISIQPLNNIQLFLGLNDSMGVKSG